MTLTLHADRDAIRHVLGRAVAADPVRGTLLGTLAMSLDDGAWCAADGTRLAVRSGREYPLVLAGEWDDMSLRELIAVLPGLADLRGVSGPPAAVQTVVAALWPGRPTARMGQCLFRLHELIEPARVPGTAVVAGPAQRGLVRSWYAAFMTEADAVERNAERAADHALDAGGCYLWLHPGGSPLSLAARRPVVAGSARIGPVYTPPEHRGRGYGSAVTAAATRSILADGAVPVLFTDLANPTSNRIYQAMGYRPVEDRVVVLVS